MANRKYTIGRLTIGGDDYPACINVRVMQRMEESGLSLENALTGEVNRWTNLVKLLYLVMEEGARLAGTEKPPTEDELAAMIDVTDLQDVSDQLAVLLGAKGRTVEADPPKN